MEDIFETLKGLHIDFDSITDEATRVSVQVLLNIVEQLARNAQQQKEENQFLKDEINRLKGEQGRPAIRAQKKMEIFPQKKRENQKLVQNLKPGKKRKTR